MIDGLYIIIQSKQKQQGHLVIKAKAKIIVPKTIKTTKKGIVIAKNGTTTTETASCLLIHQKKKKRCI